MVLHCLTTFAANDTATVTMSFTIPPYTNITPMTNTVLTANVVNDRVINPLHVRYRVVTNMEEVPLYLTTKSLVDGGYEYSMFNQGGQVYIALTSIGNASLQNLTEAKCNLRSNNVLVLPVTSITGAEYRFVRDKYELYIKNGTHFIDLHIGLFPPIGGTKNGIYQATVYLTETEI